MRPSRHGLLLLALPCVALAAQGERAVDVAIQAHVYKPRLAAADSASLSLPNGFEIAVFAKDLGNPRIIAVAANGDVYVSRRESGDVVMLRDRDGDGRAEPPVVVATRPQLHGIFLQGDTVYLATVKEVLTAEVHADGRFGPLRTLIDDLPDGGQHPNRTLAIGPNGLLYVSVGSTCNACTESSPESAALLESKPDGSAREIYASGLRNTIGFAWHPRTRELWGMDHGIDWLGDDEQPEELNRLGKGRKYGWPYVHGKGGFNPQDEPPKGITLEEWAQESEAPVLGYAAHAAPMQLVFYTGTQFPAEYQGDAFVSFRGSWNRKPASGYEVARIEFDAEGRPLGFRPFLTGFLREGGTEHTGRPVGLAQTPDGALLVGDDTNGVVYRVNHAGSGEAR